MGVSLLTPFPLKSVVGMSWLLRVISLFLFTVEGHVYLYKVGVAREVAKRKIMDCLQTRKTREESTDGEDSDRDSSCGGDEDIMGKEVPLSDVPFGVDDDPNYNGANNDPTGEYICFKVKDSPTNI